MDHISRLFKTPALLVGYHCLGHQSHYMCPNNQPNLLRPNLPKSGSIYSSNQNPLKLFVCPCVRVSESYFNWKVQMMGWENLDYKYMLIFSYFNIHHQFMCISYFLCFHSWGDKWSFPPETPNPPPPGFTQVRTRWEKRRRTVIPYEFSTSLFMPILIIDFTS